MDSATRLCRKCNETKHVREFYQRGKSRRSHCKSCEAKACHARRQKPEIKEQRASDMRLYRQGERYKALQARRKDKALLKKEKRRLYMKKRRSGDIAVRIRDGLIRRLSKSLERAGFTSDKSFEEKLGTNFNEFLAKIREELPWGYAIDDYGEFWNIDHICPTKQARTSEEAEKLQNHRNLRPLLKEQNMEKGTKRTPEGEALCLELLGREWDVTLEKKGRRNGKQ